MKPSEHLQTMSFTYQEIRQGEPPWIALGNFLNDWFDYEKERREALVADPILFSEKDTPEAHRWATFCAASVEYLCRRYSVPCPSWVYDAHYCLSEPWFDSPGAYKLSVRQRLIHQTPEAFSRRNIYCGNRMFANKYEFAEQQRQMTTRTLI